MRALDFGKYDSGCISFVGNADLEFGNSDSIFEISDSEIGNSD